MIEDESYINPYFGVEFDGKSSGTMLDISDSKSN